MNAILLSLCLATDVAAQPPPETIFPVPAPGTAIAPPPPPTFLPPKRPPTLDEFLCTFVPLPGTYEVTIIHPVTKKPVCFAFQLPNCPLKKVHRCMNRVTFEYCNKSSVTLIFRIISGRVDVRYD